MRTKRKATGEPSLLEHADQLQQANAIHLSLGGFGPTSNTSLRGLPNLAVVTRLDGFLVRGYDDIKPGNALMYYPEANTLVSRSSDPKSKTPAFKGAVIRLEAMS